MRVSGECLPWQTCTKPPLSPSATCSAAAITSQFLFIGSSLIGEPSLAVSAVRLCQQASGLFGALALAPILEHRLAPPRIAPLGLRERGDPIGAKVPVVLAQLAPRHHHAHLFKEADRERPDGPLAGRAILLAI